MIRIIKRELKNTDPITEETVPQPIMVGTKMVDGMILTDSIVTEAPTLDESIVGAFEWDGKSASVVTLKPIDEATFIAHLPNRYEFDEEGNVVATHPPVLHEPCRWSGWPPCWSV